MSDYVNHFALHYMSPWREQALDTELSSPLWFRVMCLAYGSHRRNGHASFESGGIAKLLGVSANRVSEAIADAKNRGLIDLQSTSRCLIVPSHWITQGPGVATEPCAYCAGKRVGRRKPSTVRKTVRQATTTPLSERAAEANSDTTTPPLDLVQAARNQQVSVSSNVVPLRTGANVTQINC